MSDQDEQEETEFIEDVDDEESNSQAWRQGEPSRDNE